MEEPKICHNCDGLGTVGITRKSDCYYCRGKGVRSSNYRRDKDGVTEE